MVNILQVINPDGTRENIGNVGVQPIISPESGNRLEEKETGLFVGGGGGSAELTEALTSNVAIGQIVNGTKYEAGTPLEKIIRDMLTKIIAPSASWTYTPNKRVYDKVNETLSKLTFSIKATKGTNDIKLVEIYIDNVKVKAFDNVASGGTFPYEHTFDPATNADAINLKYLVQDTDGLKAEGSATIKFVGKSYYGYVDKIKTKDTLTEADIHGLQNGVVKDVKGHKYEGFSFEFNKVVYAYPKSFGALSQIKDEKNNIPYTDSFDRTEITVDNIVYYVYILHDPSGADNNELTFS